MWDKFGPAWTFLSGQTFLSRPPAFDPEQPPSTSCTPKGQSWIGHPASRKLDGAVIARKRLIGRTAGYMCQTKIPAFFEGVCLGPGRGTTRRRTAALLFLNPKGVRPSPPRVHLTKLGPMSPLTRCEASVRTPISVEKTQAETTCKSQAGTRLRGQQADQERVPDLQRRCGQ